MAHKRWLPLGIAAAVAVATVMLPLRAGAEELSGYNGAQLYKRFCASCHGVQGLGDGTVAPSLNVMVPNLIYIARRHGGEFPADLVRRIIDGRAVEVPHGSRDMPVWGYEFRKAVTGGATVDSATDELVNRLVDYLRSIQKK